VEFVVQLKGFAYETIPGKGIKAGQKSDDSPVSPDPPSVEGSRLEVPVTRLTRD
jgi:hypothetical protein